MTFLKSVSVAAALIAAGPASAENSPVVVELFTSQGCSSCPPADALMHDLAKRDDVIGLALHVDYWDYIGWKDQFAKPGHTTRQKAYAHEGGRSMIYTPQMVVNGQEDVVGAREVELMALIADHQSRAPVAAVTASRTGGTVKVTVEPVGEARGSAGAPFVVQIVGYAPSKHVSIKRGELAGHDLSYANVVESWAVIGDWNGAERIEFAVPFDVELDGAVLVQQPAHGAIVAAAHVN